MIPTSATTTGRNVRLGLVAVAGIAIVYPILPFHPTVCPLFATTGIPCPLCGMTRSVSAAVHGNILQSLSYNPAGIAFIALAIYAFFRPEVVRAKPPIWLAAVVLGALWIWNIGFNPTFSQLLLR
jgi:hypothetical protein